MENNRFRSFLATHVFSPPEFVCPISIEPRQEESGEGVRHVKPVSNELCGKGIDPMDAFAFRREGFKVQNFPLRNPPEILSQRSFGIFSKDRDEIHPAE